MIDRKPFFDYARANLFGGTLAPGQVEGINAILDAWEGDDTLTDERYLAYMLATAHHETNATMQPVREAYWLKDPDAYLKQHHPDYYPYYGRGYVQLTWEYNYRKAGDKLGQNFIANREAVMEPENAARIMFLGMVEGWFTGKKLADYFNDKMGDWHNARRIINGVDKAALVASYGQKYFAALSAGFGDVQSGFDTTAVRA